MGLNKLKYFIPCLLLNALYSFESYSQGKTYKAIDDSVSVVVTGESTLHDWTVSVSDITNYPAELKLTPAEGEVIDSFSFQVGVASMDGGRGSAMNEKIYTALESTNFPSIVYTQEGTASIKQNDNISFSLVSNGILNVAGASRSISIEVTGVVTDGFLKLTAHQELKMSDFGIDPPSAMFGQIQTKDDIAVDIAFTYQLN
ncbi:MAG: YceI family protein [Bacteroidetes bacterium]|nr:YceI family protein [Bacteroidota bacterium]MDA1119862.1 YceI family protein [Bacteroidota bacterium]